VQKRYWCQDRTTDRGTGGKVSRSRVLILPIHVDNDRPRRIEGGLHPSNNCHSRLELFAKGDVAFGSRAHGLNRGQLLIVTDAKWEQFQVVTHINQTQLNYNLPYTEVPAPPADPDFDTSNFTATSRYEWIFASWSMYSRVFYLPLSSVKLVATKCWTLFVTVLSLMSLITNIYVVQNALPLPAGYAPIQLARIPILDPRWTSFRSPHGLVQFVGGGDAASHANQNDYYRGFEPQIPSTIFITFISCSIPRCTHINVHFYRLCSAALNSVVGRQC
jgi:hypothetical protein